jgi:hypothetical protein
MAARAKILYLPDEWADILAALPPEADRKQARLEFENLQSDQRKRGLKDGVVRRRALQVYGLGGGGDGGPISTPNRSKTSGRGRKRELRENPDAPFHVAEPSAHIITFMQLVERKLLCRDLSPGAAKRFIRRVLKRIPRGSELMAPSGGLVADAQAIRATRDQ